MNGEVVLKTPFVIQKFNNIDTFILILFPDLKSYLQKQISKGIQNSDLESQVYSELEKHFKLFIVQSYSQNLDEYIDRKAKHADKEVMKDVLLSTISITLNVNDANGNKLNKTDYLISLTNIIKKFDF
jgi:ABC-type transporter MlaC component